MSISSIILLFLHSANLQVTWGTLDTEIMPRHPVRVWVKVENKDTVERVIIPTIQITPTWSIVSGADTARISGSGYIGTFDKVIELRPENSILFYDLLDLSEISQNYPKSHRTARLLPNFGKHVKVISESPTFKVVPPDNGDLADFFDLWARIRKEYSGSVDYPQENQKLQCSILRSRIDSIRQRGKLTGKLVHQAISLKQAICNERKPVPFPMCPAWKIFDEATVCIEYQKEQGKTDRESLQICSGKIRDLHHFTQQLVGANSVIKADKGVKLITTSDTVQVFPIDYWEIP
mgnify:CR=1 FL=1